jgi:hypothetical protein
VNLRFGRKVFGHFLPLISEQGFVHFCNNNGQSPKFPNCISEIVKARPFLKEKYFFFAHDKRPNFL